MKESHLTGFTGSLMWPLQSDLLCKGNDFPQDSATALGGCALEKPTHPLKTYLFLELREIYVQLEEMSYQCKFLKSIYSET